MAKKTISGTSLARDTLSKIEFAPLREKAKWVRREVLGTSHQHFPAQTYS